MKRFVPREKASKKARRALDLSRRISWGFAPTSRKVESGKRYKRRPKHDRREEG